MSDFDQLIKLECELEDILCDVADVDGHDFGSGEANIFILTDTPKETFEKVRAHLDESGVLSSMRIAYRKIESDEFKILWPEGVTEFKVT